MSELAIYPPDDFSQDGAAVVQAIREPLAAFIRAVAGANVPASFTIAIGSASRLPQGPVAEALPLQGTDTNTVTEKPLDTLSLRGIEEAILKAAPLATEPPVTVKRLAKLAGYQYSNYFRETVRIMIDRGLLSRFTGGVRQAR